MKRMRSERLKSEIQKLVYDIIKNKIKNPLITEMFSISEVELSNDGEHAKVFISVFSTDKAKADATFNAIVDSTTLIRRELACEMRIRVIPQLAFIHDTSEEYAQNIDKIISGFTYGDNNDNK